jgi:hypothetical protein
MPALPFAILPLGELIMAGGLAEVLVVAVAFVGMVVQLTGTMVDFQRAAVATSFADLKYSQIVGQWRDLLAGKYLDWLPVRLYAAHGLAALLAFATIPVVMMTWATLSLKKMLSTGKYA